MTREGVLVRIDGKPALRFERRYRHSPERVWRAITEPSEMAQWFPSNVEGDRVVGAELTFVDDAQRAAAIESGEPTRVEGPMFHGRVITFDPPNVFAFTWGAEVLRFELLPDGNETVLVFTQLLSHQSVAARNGAGWHACLGALDGLLGAAVSEAEPDWRRVYQDYVRRVGPELGVPTGHGGMTWERSTHVDPDRVRTVTSHPAEMEAWGGRERSSDPLRWDIESTEHGTLYRLTHGAIDRDARLAAMWHALLIQLDMYLAAGQLVEVDEKPWIAAYEEVL
jgi:uncharacterized protein YndB with AHSA1/START domain